MTITNHLLYLYAKAAEDLGINYKIVDPQKLILIEINNTYKPIFMTSLFINNEASAEISQDKTLTYKLLKKNQIPIPQYKIYTSLSELPTTIKSSIVIKPNKGIGGKGVTIQPTNTHEITQAFNEAKKYNKKVVVEDFVKGNNYRVLMLDGQVLALTLRNYPTIEGNATDSIQTLIDTENKKRIKENKLKSIVIDTELLTCLEQQNLTLNSILEDHKTIQVRRNSNLSTGGTSENLPISTISDENLALIKKAVSLIGLRLAGVDIITKDISKSIINMGGIINEINSSPGFRMHHYPTKGQPINIAKRIISHISHL